MLPDVPPVAVEDEPLVELPVPLVEDVLFPGVVEPASDPPEALLSLASPPSVVPRNDAAGTDELLPHSKVIAGDRRGISPCWSLAPRHAL